MLQDLQYRCNLVNQRDKAAWAKVNSREVWEKFRNPRTEALKVSLGPFPPTPKASDVYITGVIEGDGWNIENLVYESRPGLYVTANLYVPSSPQGKTPVIVIVHSHHNPKTQGELQDMGMTWARAGCMLMVMDQLSYGERRQHKPGPRQDYRFRYINGIQLHTIGHSLMGWMVWDIMRGIDLLLNRSNVDKDKIILMGSVAGGGDVAAVAGAIDSRIKCVIPFNFGGPQPETQYPLPDDAEDTFNYMGEGSWESTRNLRLSGRDGFLPWVIVASVAPRHLIYAHEFSWDKEHDPVWKRLEKVFGFYDARDNLSFTHGFGELSERPPNASHCNNIGPVHRKMIHSALERWFGIPIPDEYENRLPESKLMCLKPNFPKQRPLNGIFAEIGVSRANEFKKSLDNVSMEAKKDHLRQKWAELLGKIDPKSHPNVEIGVREIIDGIPIDRILLKFGEDAVIPMLSIHKNSKSPNSIIGVAQGGKEGFLKNRVQEISDLLDRGFAIFLPDIIYTGENCAFESRDRQSQATSISSTELMLGQTVLSRQLRDLRSVISYINSVGSVKIALWGDSFAPANPPDFEDPLIDEGQSPHQSEPLGGILALLGALYEDNINAVIARGIIAGYGSLLDHLFCYIPHDAVIPGVLTAGDLGQIASILSPCPLRIESPVDGRNCPISLLKAKSIFEPVILAYNNVPNALWLSPETINDLGSWMEKSFSGQCP